MFNIDNYVHIRIIFLVLRIGSGSLGPISSMVQPQIRLVRPSSHFNMAAPQMKIRWKSILQDTHVKVRLESIVYAAAQSPLLIGQLHARLNRTYLKWCLLIKSEV